MIKAFFPLLCLLATLSGCGRETKPTDPPATVSVPVQTVAELDENKKEEMIKRGGYLVSVAACHDCHTPKKFTATGWELDSSRLLSGHPQDEPLPQAQKGAGTDGWVRFTMGLTAAMGPWGTSFAANLTPDATGTRHWTFENFETAIRKGKSKGLIHNRDLLPPMPWQVYQNFTDDDLKSIFLYIKSLPPVKNMVPAPIPPAGAEAQVSSVK